MRATDARKRYSENRTFHRTKTDQKHFDSIDECREAIRINEGNAEAHNSLAVALADKGRLDEVITEYEKAIRLKKDYGTAHDNLAFVLRCKAASEKLPDILKGEAQPADVGDCVELACLCQLPFKGLYAASVRFYRQAFAEKPQLADDLPARHRYNAACAAALAGCGRGQDANKLDTNERAGLRKQALDWLRADLKAYRQVMDKSADKAGPEIAQRMQDWLQDTDFTGVRGPAALDRLPEAERGDWQKLWEEVEALRQRAAKAAQPASGARP